MMTEKASGWCLSFFFLWLILRMSGEEQNTFWKFFIFPHHSCCSTFSCLSTISDCKNLRHQTDWPSITTVRHDDNSNTKEIIKYKGDHCGNHTKKEKKKTLGNKYCERKWKKNAPLTVANMISLTCDKRSHLKAADLELMEVVVKVWKWCHRAHSPIQCGQY